LNARRRPKSPVASGELVAGRYRVGDAIAAGGMGVVVAARHETLEQAVAIKFLDPELMDDEQTVPRFLREARAAARIQSEHVARVFDCGTLETGVPFMVMELLTGHDLGRELKTRGKLPVDEAVDLLLQALEGVAEAHAIGVVHRDIKPTNLFLVARTGAPPLVKVLDFGISKLASGVGASVEDGLTTTSLMLGSPRYMSPEQAQNARNVDARTDLWSLGVVLFEMLAGRPPFLGSTMGEIIGQLVQAEPPLLRSCRADAPAELEAVVARCLARNRELRWPNAAELAVALGPFASPRTTSSLERIRGLRATGKLPAEPVATLEIERTVAPAPTAGAIEPRSTPGSTIPGASLSRIARSPEVGSHSGGGWKWIAFAAIAVGGVGAAWGFAQTRHVEATAPSAAAEPPAPAARATDSAAAVTAPQPTVAASSPTEPAPAEPSADPSSPSSARASAHKPPSPPPKKQTPPASPSKPPGDAMLRQRD
jgi:Protein kinase domain